MADFFTKEMSQNYDAKNRRLAPIADNMHFLIGLLLKDLPSQARILCVGIGTGAEILSLAKERPQWQFVGVDPSASMLEVCQQKLQEAGIEHRCQLIHGYIQDVPEGEHFDGALSVLVAHFVSREERLSFFQNIFARLKKSGCFVNTEISCDLNSPEFPQMLEVWSEVQKLMGATPESLASLPRQLKDVLTVLSPAETESLLQQCGVSSPLRFFQALMIVGWFGRKS